MGVGGGWGVCIGFCGILNPLSDIKTSKGTSVWVYGWLWRGGAGHGVRAC